MLTAPSGASGFIARHHAAVLAAVAALTGIATAVATALAWFQSIVWIDVAALALGAVLAGAIAFWQTRHAALAAVTALAPLPGLLWAAPLSSGTPFGLIPGLGYGFGFALAALYAAHVLGRVLRVGTRETPWFAAGVALAVAAMLIPVWFDGLHREAAVQAVCDAFGASLSVLLLLPISLPLLAFDEEFVARANRARERRGRLYEWLGGATVPRWGLSFTGIALVFVALGWFDSEAVLQSGWWRYGVTAVLVCGALGVFAGGWREGLALGLVLTVVCLLAQWWRSYQAQPFGAVDSFAVTLLAGFLATLSARHIRFWRKRGDRCATANRRALECADSAVFAGLGAVCALLPWLYLSGTGAIVLALAAGGLCGALLYPAVLTALEAVVPRRRTVEEVFARN